MIVYNTTGSSAFTDDPNRHHILEPATSITPTSMIPYMLPNRDVTNFLVESYFINVWLTLYFPLYNIMFGI
jgi:hypothetical protein